MRIPQLLSAALLLLLFFVSSQCRADPHKRDGFYFSLRPASAGRISGARVTIRTTSRRATSRINRVARLTGALLLGLPLRPGLAIGVGGLVSAHGLSSPKRTENGQPVTWEDGGGPYLQLLGTVGPFVDYYPSAALGWHVQQCRCRSRR